jgi:hypothetical protein
MTRARPLTLDDVPQAADLIWRFVYGQEGSTQGSLEYYLQQLFLTGPYADPVECRRSLKRRDLH